MNLEKYDYTKYFIFSSILLAAFVNFKNPAIGSLIVLFLEICIIISILKTRLINVKIINLKLKEISTIITYIVTISLSTVLVLVENKSEDQLLFSLVRYIEILSHILTIFTLSIYFYNIKQKENLFLLIPISVVLASIICFLDYHLNSNSVMNNNGFKLIVSYNIRQIGYVVMLGCLFCIVKLIFIERKWDGGFYVLLFIINCSMLFWLGGRGATLAFIASIILLISILKKEFIAKCKILVSTVILMILSYIVSIPFSVFSWNGANRFYMMWSQHIDEPLRKISNGRFELWQESISLILQKPLLGYGPEAHAFETKIGFLQPHNALLQSLLEFGIMGTIPFLIMIFYIVKNAKINSAAEPTINNLFCFGLISAILIHSLYSGPLYHATSMILVCIASAYILSVTLKRKNKN
ncbi:O-antigen ligase family protein [Vibrio sp. EA2]|uniref:O-antigen ligase family protein n=1 Tax=Vibrio sp. EA2 TaxID=3079860 RepID=UPI00294A33AB|nr:O-antigen ligase family protein [Vibrio sp. EA2]MDV6251378.1 O-antigen ligase family protein [Vibrio sp. EA2]